MEAFDGHEGTLGRDVGVRAADPGMLVSMGGLSGAGQVALDIVTTMRLWFQKVGVVEHQTPLCAAKNLA